MVQAQVKAEASVQQSAEVPTNSRFYQFDEVHRYSMLLRLVHNAFANLLVTSKSQMNPTTNEEEYRK